MTEGKSRVREAGGELSSPDQEDSAPGSKPTHQRTAGGLLPQDGCRKLLQGKLWLNKRTNLP